MAEERVGIRLEVAGADEARTAVGSLVDQFGKALPQAVEYATRSSASLTTALGQVGPAAGKAGAEAKKLTQDLGGIKPSFSDIDAAVASTKNAFSTLGLDMSKGLKQFDAEKQAASIRAAFEQIRTSSFATTEDVTRAQAAMNAKLADLSKTTAATGANVNVLGTAFSKLSGLASAAGVQTGAVTQAMGTFQEVAGLASSNASLLTIALGSGVVAFGALTGALISTTSHLTSSFQSIKQFAAISGLAAGDADDLADAMEAVGISTETLSMAIFKISADAESGGAALQKLGISVEEIQTLGEGELFERAIDGIQNLGTQSEKTSALIDLFGARFGRQFAELVRDGAMSLEELKEKVADLSPWTEQMAQRARELGMAQTFLANATGGVVDAIGSAFAPVLTAATNKMTDLIVSMRKAIEDGPELQSIIDGVSSVFASLWEALEPLLPLLKMIGAAAMLAFKGFEMGINLAMIPITALMHSIGGIAQAIVKLAKGDFSGAWNAVTKGFADADAAAQRQTARFNASVASTDALIQKYMGLGTVIKDVSDASDKASTGKKAPGPSPQQLQEQVSRLQSLKAEYEAIQSVADASFKLRLVFDTSAETQIASLMAHMEALQETGRRTQEIWTAQQAAILADTKKTPDQIKSELAKGQAEFRTAMAAVTSGILADVGAISKVTQDEWKKQSDFAKKAAEDINKVDDAYAKMYLDISRQGAVLTQDLFSTGELDSALMKIERDFQATMAKIQAGMGEMSQPTQLQLDAMEQATKNKLTALELLWKNYAIKASADSAEAVKGFTGAFDPMIDQLARKIRLLPDEIGKSEEAVNAFIRASLGIPAMERSIASLQASFGGTTEEIKRQEISIKETGKTWEQLSASTDKASIASAKFVAEAAKTSTVEAAWKQAGTAMRGLQDQLQMAQVESTLTGDAFLRASMQIKLFGDAFDPLDPKMVAAVNRAMELQRELDRMIPQQFSKDLADIATKAQLLGDNFDAMGARVSAAQKNFDATWKAMERGTASFADVTAAANTWNAAIADQKLYQNIESAFLSITDTFTKMADGMIQGTLDIADAFANLGRSLLTNFVQLVLHQVFDPVLQAAASFTSGLIRMVFGGGSSGSSGSFFAQAGLQLSGSVFGALFPSLAPAANAVIDLGEYGAGPQGGLQAAYSGVSGAAGLYNLLAPLAKLPTLTSLIADGFAAIVSWIGAGAPTVATGAWGAAGFGGPTVAAIAAEAGTTAATAGSASVLAGLSAMWPVAAFTLPLVIAQVVHMLTAGAPSWYKIQEQRKMSYGQLGDFADDLDLVTSFADLQNEQIRQTIAYMGGFAESMNNMTKAVDESTGQWTGEGSFSLGQKFLAQISQLGIAPQKAWSPEDQEMRKNAAAIGEITLANVFFNFQKESEQLLKMWSDRLELLGVTGEGTVEPASLEQAAMVMQITRASDVLQAINSRLELGVKALDFEALGIDLKTVTSTELQVVVDQFKADVLAALVKNPVKILSLMDLSKFSKEGEDIEATAQRLGEAFITLGAMMVGLRREADAIAGGDPVAALNELRQEITDRFAAIRVSAEGVIDPTSLVPLAQEAEALIRRKYELENALFEQLIAKINTLTSAVSSAASGMAQNAGLLYQSGTNISNLTGQMIAFAGAMPTVASTLNATGGALALWKSNLAIAAQTRDPAQIQGAIANAGGMLDLFWGSLEQIGTIKDPVQRMSALNTVLGQLGDATNAAMDAVRAYYNGLIAEAQRLMGIINQAATGVASAASTLAAQDWLPLAGIDFGPLTQAMISFGAAIPTVEGTLTSLGGAIDLWVADLKSINLGAIEGAPTILPETTDALAGAFADAYQKAMGLADSGQRLGALNTIMADIGTVMKALQSTMDPEAFKQLVAEFGPGIQMIVDSITTASQSEAQRAAEAAAELKTLIGDDAMNAENFIVKAVGDMAKALDIIVQGAAPLFNAVATAMTNAGHEIAGELAKTGGYLQDLIGDQTTAENYLATQMQALGVDLRALAGEVNAATAAIATSAAPALASASGTDLLTGSSDGILVRAHPGEMILNATAASNARRLGLSNASLMNLRSYVDGTDSVAPPDLTGRVNPDRGSIPRTEPRPTSTPTTMFRDTRTWAEIYGSRYQDRYTGGGTRTTTTYRTPLTAEEVDALVDSLVNAASAVARFSDLLADANVNLSGISTSLFRTSELVKGVDAKAKLLGAALNILDAELRQSTDVMATLAGAAPGAGLAIKSLADAAVKSKDLTQLTTAFDAIAGAAQSAQNSVSAAYDRQRQLREESDREQQDAINDQLDTLRELVRTTEDWSRVADSLRDQIFDLRMSDLAPPNPYGQFNLAQSEFASALASFRAGPTTEGAGRVQELARAMLDAATKVYTKPDPAYTLLFDETVRALESVQATAIARGANQEELLAQIAALETRSQEINDATRVAILQLDMNEAAARQAITDFVAPELTRLLAAMQTAGNTAAVQAIDMKSIATSTKTMATDINAIRRSMGAGYASGIASMPRTTWALVHEGERIVPAEDNVPGYTIGPNGEGMQGDGAMRPSGRVVAESVSSGGGNTFNITVVSNDPDRAWDVLRPRLDEYLRPGRRGSRITQGR